MYFLDGRFLAFVPVLFAIYWTAPNRARSWVLLAGNLAWLCVFSPSTIVALAALATAIVYPLARASERLAKSDPRKARVLGIAGVVALVVVATVLRLKAYFLPELSYSSPTFGDVFQWIGFSYFVLKGIHVLLTSSRGILPSPSLFALLHYVLFLPTLTSGPIYRIDEFSKQLAAPKTLRLDDVQTGVLRIVWGMAKKVVAVPLLGAVVSALRARGVMFQPPAYVTLYVMLFLDFSGYSDIAIGTGRLLGFAVPENFKNPFTATTLTQFWRNWHATLGDWLRENVFIPLGGVRAKGWYLAAIVVGSMLIIGLWHSYTPVFIGWGVYHGVMLLVENRLDVKPLRRHNTPWWRLGLRYALIQAVVIGGMFAFMRL